MRPQTFAFVVVVMLVAAIGLMFSGRPPVAPPVPQPPPPTPHTITVTGEGVVRAAPDVAQLRFTIESTGDTAEAAKSANDKTYLSLLGRLHALGVEQSDIDTLAMRSARGAGVESAGQPAPRSAALDMQVTVRELSRLPLIQYAIVQADPSRMEPVRYDLTERDDPVRLATARAVADAHLRAVALAQFAGLRLQDRPLQSTLLEPNPLTQQQLPVEEGQIVVRVRVQATFST